jgi:hypothetical protein
MVNSLFIEIMHGEKNGARIIRTSRTQLGQRDTQGSENKDGIPLGYISADDEEFIYVLSSRSREYRIPKSHVMDFDGPVVLLDLRFGYLEGYKIR